MSEMSEMKETIQLPSFKIVKRKEKEKEGEEGGRRGETQGTYLSC